MSGVGEMQVPNGTGPGVRRSRRHLSGHATPIAEAIRKHVLSYKVKIGNKSVWRKGHGLV